MANNPDKPVYKESEKLRKIREKQERARQKKEGKEARRVRRKLRNKGELRKSADELADGLMHTVKAMLDYAREQIEQNIRLQMIAAFLVCFVVALIIFYSTLRNYGRLDDRKYIDFEEPTQLAQGKMIQLIDNLGNYDRGMSATQLNEFIADEMNKYSDTATYYIVDNRGSVLDSNNPEGPKSFDFHALVQDLQENAMDDMKVGRYTQLVSIRGESQLWLLIQDQLQGVVKYKKAGNMAVFIAILQATAVFILMFYLITKQKIVYIQRISSGIGIIAKGELDHQVPEAGRDELYVLAKSINHMSRSLKSQIEVERQAERSKQELITNVSHDLRTPLTSVLGYLKLVIDKKYDSPEQMEEYLQTVYNKSEKLKALIDDLFDYTKLTYSGIALSRVRISLNELVEQMVEEYIPVLNENQLEINLILPEAEPWCMVDPQKLHRVLENLLSNAVKYSDRPGSITVSIDEHQNGYRVRMDNPAAHLEGVDLSKIFDRFYRLDSSRSSATGGSGLGLGIAKGLVEAHGGTMAVGYSEKRINFELWLPTGAAL